MDTVTMLIDQNLRQGSLSLNFIQWLQYRLKDLIKMNFRQYFSPVRDDQQVSPFENRVLPLDTPDELQDITHIKSLIQGYFVLSLNFAHNSN